MWFSPSSKRKIYFIKKDFQTRFILRFVFVATAWSAATVGLYAYLANKKLERLRFSNHIDITTTNELLLPLTVGVATISLLVFALFLAYTFHSLWKSLSPPLLIIKKDLAKMADGELASAINLPEPYEFQDLAAELDEMREALREKIVRLKNQQLILAAAAAELNGAIATGSPSSASAAALRLALAQMQVDVNAFHYPQ
ncbi:MAG: hypothetical protein A2505_08650 [Deltaproteobacteria bacterium RIFOXYD12_FULL_55_16]|nr:MAG: hypothetical protein A2505_08650 [Deltaproteobacteria bacterium RIFOXYD12_FULL_55_16]